MRRAQGGGRLDATTAVAAAQAHGQDKAESVLMRIRQKLGRELSVEYQVNHLIQEARDTKHLAKIYIGWQPWL
jgi:ataxia telangiectasia mutated family protein